MSEAPVVSDAEIQKIENQVKEGELNERKQLEEQVRKELSAEQKARQLEEQLAQQKKVAEDARAEAEKAKAEAEIYAKKIAEQRVSDSRSRAPMHTNNPFTQEQPKTKVTPEMVKSVEMASLDAFLRSRDKTRGR